MPVPRLGPRREVDADSGLASNGEMRALARALHGVLAIQESLSRSDRVGGGGFHHLLGLGRSKRSRLRGGVCCSLGACFIKSLREREPDAVGHFGDRALALPLVLLAPDPWRSWPPGARYLPQCLPRAAATASRPFTATCSRIIVKRVAEKASCVGGSVNMAAGGYAFLTQLRIKIILVFIIITSLVHSLVNQF